MQLQQPDGRNERHGWDDVIKSGIIWIKYITASAMNSSSCMALLYSVRYVGYGLCNALCVISAILILKDD